MELQVVPHDREDMVAQGFARSPRHPFPPVVIVGLTHHVAAVEVREAAAIADEAVPELLRRLCAARGVRGAMVLSTCNRTEFFLSVDPDTAAIDNPLELIAAALPRHVAWLLRGRAHEHVGDAAVRHGVRLASGLDSALVGEAEIVRQLRSAHRAAKTAGTLDGCLDLLIREFVARSRHIRGASGLNRRPDGLGALVARHAEEQLGALRDRTAVIVGVGMMGTLVAERLAPVFGRLVLVSRTGTSARALAARLAGTVEVADALHDVLDAADMVVCATGADAPILTARQLVARAPDHPLTVVDVGVPRNVDPEVGERPGVSLLDIDAVSRLRTTAVDEGIRGDVARAETLAHDEAEALVGAMRERWLSTGSITELTRWAEEVRQRQVALALKHMPELDTAAHEQLERLTQSLVRKLLDRPIRFIRQNAEAPDVLSVVVAALGVSDHGGAA